MKTTHVQRLGSRKTLCNLTIGGLPLNRTGNASPSVHEGVASRESWEAAKRKCPICAAKKPERFFPPVRAEQAPTLSLGLSLGFRFLQEQERAEARR